MSHSQLLKPWTEALRAQRKRVLLGFALMFVTAAAGVALLGLSGWFISAAAVFVVAFDIFVPGGAIRALALLRTLSRYAERVYNHDLILRLQQRWRVKLFNGLVKQPLLMSEKFRLAHVLQRMTQDLNALDDLYIRVFAPFALAAASGGLLGLAFWFLSPALAWVVWLLSAGLIALHALLLAPRLRDSAAAELSASEHMRHASLAFVESKAELHAWQVLPDALNSLDVHQHRLQQRQHYLRRRLIIVQGAVELCALLSVLLVLAIALQAAFKGAFSIPLAVLSGLAVLAMLDQWLLLPQASLLWGRIIGAAERLQPLLASTEPRAAPLDSAAAKQLPVAGKDLVLKRVVLQGRQLPAPLNLTLSGHSITVMSGLSGAGKSSLLNFLSGAIPAQHGQVFVGGELLKLPLTHLDAATLTQHNAVLAQTVAVNLRLASAGISDNDLWAMLERVELADHIEQLPQQLDTWLGDGGVQLSGGQQRRLALARTLLYARQRDLVLLDEPFNGVGDAQATRIWQRIAPLLHGKTVLIASHQATPFVTAQGADDLVQLDLEMCYHSAP